MSHSCSVCRHTLLSVAGAALCLGASPSAWADSILPGTAVVSYKVGISPVITRAVTTTAQTLNGQTVFAFSDDDTVGNGTGISISGTIDPAGVLNYVIDAANFGTQNSFQVGFLAPIDTASFTSAQSTLSSERTDLDGNGSAISLLTSNTSLNLIIQPALQVGNANCELAPGFAPTTITSCGSLSSFEALNQSVDVIGTDLSFVLTQRDTADFTGSVTLGLAPSAITPEPSSCTLLASGLGMLWIVTRKRLSSRRPSTLCQERS